MSSNKEADSESDEVDQLDESDNQPTAGTAFSNPADEVLEQWGKDIPMEKFLKWSNVPPAIRAKELKKKRARENAKSRREAKKAHKDVEKKERNAKLDTKASKAVDKGGGGETQGSKARPITRGEQSKRKAARDEDSIPVHESSDTENKPPVKRSRTDDSSVSREYTAYILVQKPEPPQTRTAKFTRAKPASELTSVEPVFFGPDETFEEFLVKIAKALSCTPNGIDLEETAWMFEKPKNGQKRPLRSEASYQAMIMQLYTRKQDSWVINVHTRPPKQTQKMRASVQSEHGYGDDYIKDPMGLSIREQIESAAQEHAPFMQRLEDRYPENNMLDVFPNKRVLARNGQYWELNKARLQAWAAAWAKGKPGVDINSPPNSMHFDVKSTLHVPRNALVNDPSLRSSVMVPLAATSGMPLAHSSLDALLPALAQAQQQYQMMQMLQTLAAASAQSLNLPAAITAPSNAATTSKSTLPTPPAPANRSSLSLADFCAIYQIPGDDGMRLQRLGMVAGDSDLDNTPEGRWREEGFTPYTWGRIVLANRAYLDEMSGSS
ncbi:hypothetical protein LXA43DRAFT_1088470 [Ganoderma leucocontextum]|nr:hypothetical protein LXA43DRAFT_1088470 [Ganoderma leucocontextum]